MFVDLHHAKPEHIDAAASVLCNTFIAKGIRTWDTIESARKEVGECLTDGFICAGYVENNELVGWVGLRPMYGNTTWELHPLVVATKSQRSGIGRMLLQHVEALARKKSILNIVLGTDDETGSTSLSDLDFQYASIPDAMQNITNKNNHPYEFYQRCGYRIVGIIPDASGKGKPDIWMWKSLA